jgi:hypothetical protein
MHRCLLPSEPSTWTREMYRALSEDDLAQPVSIGRTTRCTDHPTVWKLAIVATALAPSQGHVRTSRYRDTRDERGVAGVEGSSNIVGMRTVVLDLAWRNDHDTWTALVD